MEKLRFEFTILPGIDGKTNIFAITSISTIDNKIFAIPEELQSVAYHKEIAKTGAFTKVKNSLKKRYQVRRVWISLTDELESTYVDDDGNLQFGGLFLEEIDQNESVSKPESLEKIINKITESSQGEKSLKHIAERFVIEKFTTEVTNADHWIDVFEKECIRFGVSTDERKIEILRLFMDKNCADWYSSMIMKLTINSEWTVWKTKFCETFANKGWNPVTNALLFKYKEGSLLDYAMKKEKLLLEMRRSIDTGTLVDLIAAGLPEFILNKIDRETLKDVVDLFNEVSKYEHVVDKRLRHWQFKVGDMVYVENGNKLNRKKLDEVRIGPYKILEKVSDTIFRIDTGHKKIESSLFHITKLVPSPAL